MTAPSHPTRSALGDLRAPTVLIGDEHSDTNWLPPTCFEQLNLFLGTLPTPPWSAEPHRVGTQENKDDQELVPMG